MHSGAASPTSALPAHLSGHRAMGLPREIAAHEPWIAQYELGTMQNLIYLLICWKTRHAAIVDPQKDLSPLDDLKREGITLTHLLLTHSHHDHVAGIPGVLERFPEIPIYVGARDRHRISKWERPEQPTRDYPLLTDAPLRVGELGVRAHPLPGHSAGAMFLEVRRPGDDAVAYLTGDTLFIRDCGRTDLPTGSDTEMWESLGKIKRLDPHGWILPGHHYKPEVASTLARELQESPPLLARSIDEFRSLP